MEADPGSKVDPDGRARPATAERRRGDGEETVMSEQTHYREPGWFTRNVFNKGVAGLTRMGVSVLGSRVLEVRGRSSGEMRRTPVNLLALDGHEYLVSPRGNGQWVRNVRAADGELDLLVGRRRQQYRATELADDEKVPVLRAYLKRWKFEVGAFFGGVGPDSSDADLRTEATKHPVFVLEPR
jgi:deazaflavin-dependent oxidoreductase (nitroreductase family)